MDNQHSRFFSPSSIISTTLANTFNTHGDGNVYNVSQNVQVTTAEGMILKFFWTLLLVILQIALSIVVLIVVGTLWVICTVAVFAYHLIFPQEQAS